jgi:hypothetical protein
MKRMWQLGALFLALAISALEPVGAQGVTTGSITGSVMSSNGPVSNARVVAVHQPSGTSYAAVSRADGRFIMPGMRVGGPYTITAIAIGFARNEQQGLQVTLGSSTDVTFDLKEAAITLTGVQVTATGGALSEKVTGASTTISREALSAFPTIGRTITDFTRLTPQSSGSSFAGQDNRLNNFTLDGSSFNNAFGLGSQPGARTGVSPIPIDAIDQLQVNIAPFDVRQGNFTGAGVNAVTKSGGNEFKASIYYTTRNQGLVGTKTAGLAFNPGTFKFTQPGGYVSGPIIRNKLFFFFDYETDKLTQPATTFLANTGTQTVVGNTTRVLASDLDQLSTFLQTKLNYATGPYQSYSFEKPSTRYIGKIDLNINQRNKFSFRYSQLNSQSDQPISNSGSLGNSGGARANNSTSMSFQNSTYAILENSKSYIGELNSSVGRNMSNQIIAGYTTNDESRKSHGTLFPLVDILSGVGGSNYVSFGFEPFTPGNILKYHTAQFQDNFSIYLDKHDLTFGVTAQRYESQNGFSPGLQSAYVYNSLTDFYADANDYVANPTRTTSPITLNKFQVRYANIPGQSTPLQPLRVNTYGVYAQDDWRIRDNLKLSLGVRVDLPAFENTAFDNSAADALSFRDQHGNTVHYNSGRLPNTNPLISPRLGFNWDVSGSRTTVLRGGTGIFSGTPPYVWISNQLGNTGVLTGFDQLTNTKTRPFSPNPDTYKPKNVTGAPAASYELDVAVPDYKFSQVWRTDIGLDQRLPGGFIATVEGLYSKEMNGPNYINANLPAAQTAFTGADKRMRWFSTSTNPPANRLNSSVTNAFVLGNTSTGYSYNLSGSLTRQFSNGFFAKTAYSYGVSKNSYDPGSTASSNWGQNAQSNDPNNPGVQYSAYSPGKRMFLALSYRHEYFHFGATSVSLFTEGQTIGNTSYTFSADANGDGQTNDLLYIPRNASEMNFQAYCVNPSGITQSTANCALPANKTFSVADQQTAWDAYIAQDPYLSKRRGEYAVRNATFLPVLFRSDLGITQEIFAKVGEKRNALSVRFDILNLDNLLNRKWGSGKRIVSTTPLLPQGADANGALLYRLRNVGTDLLNTTYQHTAGTSDVWRMQLGFRYTFN